MSITIMDLAIASNTVYNFHKKGGGATGALPLKPPGYSVAIEHEDPASGFFGVVYAPARSSREYIVAYRGTVVGNGVGLKNVFTDIGIYALSKSPELILAATELLAKARRKYPNSRPLLCGHSLGGAIATIVAFRNSLPCCTFNAPTVSKLFRNQQLQGVSVIAKSKTSDIENQILNFNMKWDPVSKASKRVGGFIPLPASFGPKAHSQDEVIKSLGATEYASKKFMDMIRPGGFAHAIKF